MLLSIDELFEKFKKAKLEERLKILEEIAEYDFTSKYEVVKVLNLLIEIIAKSSSKLKGSAIKTLVRFKERGALDLLIDEVQEIFGEFEEGRFDFGIEEEETVQPMDREELGIHDFYDIFSEFHPEKEVKKEEIKPEESKEEEKRKAKEKREKYPDLMDFEIPED
ncbi:MAG: hypothetical protein QMD82_02040 [bacterium]|nr:hypothetical protein [bacterium]